MSKDDILENVMTINPIYATKHNTIIQVMELFSKFDLHHIPVLENEKIIGIISTKDVVKHLLKLLIQNESNGKQVIENLLVENIMTANPQCLLPEEKISLAAKIMLGRKFNSIPVAENGELKGIITTKDILNHLIKN